MNLETPKFIAEVAHLLDNGVKFLVFGQKAQVVVVQCHGLEMFGASWVLDTLLVAEELIDFCDFCGRSLFQGWLNHFHL